MNYLCIPTEKKDNPEPECMQKNADLILVALFIL